MINMKDVAQQAGVSTATVSRVLNGKQLVSSTSREKVFSACNNLNYKMNCNIQDFVLKSRNGSTRNIAFILVDINFANPAYARLIDGISSVINRNHYHLTLVKLTGKEESIYDFPPILRDERVDGILISGNLNSNIVNLIKKLNAQCVVIGNYSEQLLGSLSSVQTNPYLSILEALSSAVKLGKKRMAYIEGNPDNYFAKTILDTYKQVTREVGLTFDKNICYFGNGLGSGIFDVMKPIFCQKNLPFDSIFCYDFRLAREISHLLMGHFGLDRKITVTIMTFWQNDDYELPVPAIYINLNLEEHIKTAFSLLINQIGGEKNSQTIMIK